MTAQLFVALFVESDYTPISRQTFVLSPGTTEHSFFIPTRDDQVLEYAENFTVTMDISGDTGAVLGPRSSVLVTIVDNDGKFGHV